MRFVMNETPEQRQVIDAQLAEALEDIRNGRVSPIFDTVEEMLASLKAPRQSSPTIEICGKNPPNF
jgi:hypothetical protein